MNRLVIVVYDRIQNLKQWWACWQVCDHRDFELIIIHSDNGTNEIKDFCHANRISYIKRPNVGYDIGAFQEFCKLEDWDKIMWCTDDIFPMSKDFLSPYVEKLTEGVGVVCTDLSPHVKTHIRTTGFMIKREVAIKLTFPADPVTTKEDCYQFEHRSRNAFYEQIIRMGLKVVQVAPRETSPMWDCGYKRRLPRGPEHFKVFPKRNKVAVICPIYNSYPQIISSFTQQTHKDWEMVLIHDGPSEIDLKPFITDPRVQYIETETRVGNWGHALRDWALKNIDSLIPDADYVVITNADNYHVPVYLEYLLKGFQNNPMAVASYCSDMVHSYKAWQVIPCRLKLGYIDCAGVLVRKDVAKETGWRDTESHSSDWIYFNDIISKYGADKWVMVKGTLLIHN